MERNTILVTCSFLPLWYWISLFGVNLKSEQNQNPNGVHGTYRESTSRKGEAVPVGKIFFTSNLWSICSFEGSIIIS